MKDITFAKILEEIEALRQSGFIRPALLELFSVIDTCAKIEYRSDKKLVQHNGECFKRFVREHVCDLYLCCLFHYMPITELDEDADISPVTKEYSHEIYNLRCCVVHENTIDDLKNGKRHQPLRLYVITPQSTSQFGCGIFRMLPNEPYYYQSVDLGTMIYHMQHMLVEYYEHCDEHTRQLLCDFDRYCADVSDGDIRGYWKAWSIDALNARNK